jgi:hypothetical protein
MTTRCYSLALADIVSLLPPISRSLVDLSSPTTSPQCVSYPRNIPSVELSGRASGPPMAPNRPLERPGMTALRRAEAPAPAAQRLSVPRSDQDLPLRLRR